jgi:hypothetical protein
MGAARKQLSIINRCITILDLNQLPLPHLAYTCFLNIMDIMEGKKVSDTELNLS